MNEGLKDDDQHGGAPDEVILEVSKIVVQARRDGKYRVINTSRTESRRVNDRFPEWFDPMEGAAVVGESQVTPGDSREPTWWVVYGNAPDDVGVSVSLTDGSTPRVQRLSGIWFCEWVSLPQKAIIHRSDRTAPDAFQFIRPRYLPPPVL